MSILSPQSGRHCDGGPNFLIFALPRTKFGGEA